MSEKDTSVIPEGPYCYRWNGKNWTDGDGMPHMGIDLCPYWKDKEINGAHVCWCDYLEDGGIYNSAERTGDFNKLIEHFGSEDGVFDALSLSLLFDQCKSCGIKDGEEGEE